MNLSRLRMRCACMFLFTLSYASTSTSEFQVVGSVDPLVAVAGEDLVLPCHLEPSVSAVNMTVEWSRLHAQDPVVHLYEDGADENRDQIQSYRGRTSLFKEELHRGNASLKLSSVRPTDEGEYKCYIQSESNHNNITVHVRVKALGTHPLISLEGYSHLGGARLSCETKDWWTEPDVQWLDGEGNIVTDVDTETQRQTKGVSIKKRITVKRGNADVFLCRVTQNDHMMEAQLIVSDDVFHAWRSAVTIITLLICIIAIGMTASFYFIHRMRESQTRIMQEDFDRKRIHAVDVNLDANTANAELILSRDRKLVTCADTKQDVPDSPERFDYSVCVLGEEGFSSGRFYYEVQVKGKTAWDLGVVSGSVNRKGLISPKCEDGFWAVRLRNGNEYQALESPPLTLSLRKKPKKAGVFVDYEEGVVSFYNVEAKTLIYSFTGQTFTAKLYPFFSPCLTNGGVNSAPLIITPVKTQNGSSQC